MNHLFPADFIWGAATAALQIEGATSEDGRGDSVWDVFCREHPERIFERATPEEACDHYHRFAEDVRLMREFGITGYRFSISWPRLFPDGDGLLNEPGAAFYDRLIDALLEAGIQPHVTLFHWDLPQSLAANGSWESPRTITAYETYAETCFRLFGDRVKRWATFNEPGWMTLNGWVTGLHPPARQEPKIAIQVATNLLAAHSRVFERFHAEKRNGEIGIVLNMSPVKPATGDPADIHAADLADAVLNRWFSDPVLHGRFPDAAVSLYEKCGMMPRIASDDRRRLEQPSADFLGVNYYYPHHASADAQETGFHLNTSGTRNEPCKFAIKGLFRFVQPVQNRATDWGWEIAPEELGDLLLALHRERPGLPIDITENGIGLPDTPAPGGQISDQMRIEFVRDHLIAIHRAMAGGANVRGYYHWSLLDNFSWINGFKKRYGFFYVDRITQERRPKASVFWYRTVSQNHGF